MELSEDQKSQIQTLIETKCPEHRIGALGDGTLLNNLFAILQKFGPLLPEILAILGVKTAA